MAPFKVIIVGGGMTGLTLANIFEQYGIDYVVLEKGEIAPALGAGFSIWAPGSRILEQLGCYEAMEKLNEPVNDLIAFDEHGKSYGKEHGFGEWVEATFAYKLRFMERREAVQTIYDNLRDKSKVYTSAGVVKVESDSDGVTVATSDGSVFHGDIVIGADGVHSRVRLEMQRLAAEDSPGRDLFPDKDSFESAWSGLFGVSHTTFGMPQDQALKSFRVGHSYLLARGPGDLMYWILFFKNDKKTQGSSIPRYTNEDRERLVSKCENDMLKPGYAFGDLYKAQIKSSMVALEEGVLKTAFYRRVVLVGDSWHKIHPLSGLGGNHAFMSAAFLADQVKSLVDKNEHPDEETLGKVFLEYQRVRAPQVDKIVKISTLMQRLEALDSPLLKFMQLNMGRVMSTDTFQNGLAKMISPAVRLKYLPLPSRRGRIGFVDEVKMDPKSRSRSANWFWILAIALVVLLFYPFRDVSNVTATTEWDFLGASLLSLDAPIAMQLYSNLSLSVVVSIICVESYRKYFSMQLMSSALPFTIASLFIGWEILVPIYFVLFVWFTAAKPSYFPSARALDLAMVKGLAPAYVLTYIGPTVCTVTGSDCSARAWTIAHAALPLSIRFCRQVASKWCTTVTGPEILYGNKDIRPFLNFLTGVGFLQVAISPTINVRTINRILSGYGKSVATDEAKIIVMDVAVLVFALFAYWDLRRISIINSADYREFLVGLAIASGVSPVTTLCILWATRERRWEEARARKTEDKEIRSDRKGQEPSR